MKKKKFEKNENWDCMTFYTIYEKNNEKYLRLCAATSRGYRPNNMNYMSYIYTIYPPNMENTLSNLLEWDIDYGIDKTKKDNNIVFRDHYVEPYDLFDIANNFIKGTSRKGSTYLDFCEITMDTECGDYYCLGGFE